jgi:hypothetical protein
MATKTARYANFYRRENKLQPSSCSSGTTWQKEIPILSRMITRRLPCHPCKLPVSISGPCAASLTTHDDEPQSGKPARPPYLISPDGQIRSSPLVQCL